MIFFSFFKKKKKSIVALIFAIEEQNIEWNFKICRKPIFKNIVVLGVCLLIVIEDCLVSSADVFSGAKLF